MARTFIIALFALGVAACQAGQPEQDHNLSERGSAPERMANTGMAAQANMGDSMPDEPGGPRGDRASGTGGDSVPSQ